LAPNPQLHQMFLDGVFARVKENMGWVADLISLPIWSFWD
jgi:hypothetical protein